MSEALDKAFNEPTEKMRETRQRSAGPEQDAWQPRLATEADVPTGTKTRNRARTLQQIKRSVGVAVLRRRPIPA